MATAKTAGGGKKPGTALAKWDEALAARAKIAKKAEASVATSEFLSLKSGQLTFRDNAVPGNKMNIIVLASRLENQFFEGEYDPAVPATPICFAFGQEEETMAPHEQSPDRQNDKCDGCQWNAFGTAEKGRGKACKNVRRLSVIPASCLDDGTPQAILDEQSAFLKVPVTSVRGWASYVQQLATMNLPPLAFVTEISVTPDPKSQFKVNFRAIERIEGDLLGALIDRADKAEKLIETPYIAMDAPAPGAKAPARKSKVQASRAPAGGRGRAAAPAQTMADIPVRGAAKKTAKAAQPAEIPVRGAGKSPARVAAEAGAKAAQKAGGAAARKGNGQSAARKF
jgi:hypothetical protein